MTARLLVDNFFNLRVYPSHALTSNENSDNTYFVGAARRTAFDAWTSTTPNLDAWNKARADQQRAADMVIIDRGHNLAGKTVKVQASDDDFTSTEDVFNAALPVSAGAGALTDTYGVLTPEGAWIKRFDVRWAHDWRAFYNAMGTGLKPLIPGLWLGLSWSPGFPYRPHSPDGSQLIVEEFESDQGWLGRGKPTKRRQGMLRFKFDTLMAAEAADWHIQQIASGRPFWVIADEQRADLACLAALPRSQFGAVLEPGWYYPALEIPFLELDPAP